MDTVHPSPDRCVVAPTSRFSLGEVWYAYDRISVHPSLSGSSFTTFTGHLASGLYARHAAATALSALGARMSTSAMAELPSGGSRMVAGPRVEMLQPAGAMKVAPWLVDLRVSAVRRSAEAAGVF